MQGDRTIPRKNLAVKKGKTAMSIKIVPFFSDRIFKVFFLDSVSIIYNFLAR